MSKGRVLIGKTGLDGHEAGAKLVVAILRDAGYEVIYTGPQQTSEMIVRTALQEDVDLIGVSFLSGTHIQVAGRILDLLEESGISTPLLLGGVIPPRDVPELMRLGVHGVLGPGAGTGEIIELVGEALGRTGGEGG